MSPNGWFFLLVKNLHLPTEMVQWTPGPSCKELKKFLETQVAVAIEIETWRDPREAPRKNHGSRWFDSSNSPEIEQLDVRDSTLFSDLRISEVEIWHFPWYSSNLGTFMMTTS